MKRRLLWIGLTVFCITAWAQQPAPGSRAADEAAIKKTALNYVEGWYDGNAERMQSALHPELAKRIARNDPATGKTQLQSMTAETLVGYTKNRAGKPTPAAERVSDVRVLDIFENAATVRAEMAGWVDYMHLAKFDGEWKIVNVLWATKTKKQ